MNAWKKSSRLDTVHYDIRGPVLEVTELLEEQGIDILKLNIGNTAPFELFASSEILNSVSHHIHESQGYQKSSGILSARSAIVEHYSNLNVMLDIDNIFIGNGVSELIHMAVLALLEVNDEVLLPSPDYPLWTAAVQLYGGKVAYYKCDEENNWNPDIDDIKKNISPRTKAIVIINPNNPTGAVYDKDLLLEIVGLAQKHNLMIFADEIYDRVIYDNTPMYHMASLTKDYPCIFFNGLSKSYRAPGFRVGWLCIYDPLSMLSDYIDGIKSLSNMRLCSNVPSQWAVAAALKTDTQIDILTASQGRLYEQRKIVMDAISEIDGMSAVTPKGSIYVFPKLDKKKFNLMDDKKLVLDLLVSKHILIMHGRAFNYRDHDHIRLVFLPKGPVLRKAMNDIKDFLTDYTQ